METSELRRGNYVSRKDIGNGSERIEIVLEIYKTKLLTSGAVSVIVNQNEIEPIPLTEEWLLKLGFENLNYGWYLNKIKLFDYSYKKGSINLKINSFDVPSTQIKYVHQLQNLHFALTEEELTIKN